MERSSNAALSGKAMFYLLLLALQFGVQPVLTRSYTPPGICRSSVVLVQEVLKFCMAGFMLRISNSAREAFKGKWVALGSVHHSYPQSFLASSPLLSAHCRLISILSRLEHTVMAVCGIFSSRIIRGPELGCTHRLPEFRRPNVQCVESNQNIVSRTVLLSCDGTSAKSASNTIAFAASSVCVGHGRRC